MKNPERQELREISREIGPMQFRATVAPGSIDAKARTVDVIWTKGARVRRSSWALGSFDEELSLDPKHVRMDRLASGRAPVLDSHDGYSGAAGVIGVVQSARLEADQGTATIRFARAEDDANADAIFRKIQDGILSNISVGYRTYAAEKVSEPDAKIPVYRAIDWEPGEISVVPMGADAGAQVREREAQATNACVFIQRQEQEMKTDKSATGSEQGNVTERAAAVETPKDAAGEAVASERARGIEVRRLGSVLDLAPAFTERHVADGTSAEAFRSIAIDERARTKRSVVEDTGRIEHGEAARDKFIRGASDWLVEKAALAPLFVEAGRKRGETVKVDGGEFRGLGFVDLARMALERNGVRTGGMDKMKLIGEALTHRISGYNGTSDFPVLLENVMHKTLLAAYGVTPDTWSLFCAIGTVSDFRPHNRYRQGTFGRLQLVNENGEFENQQIPDGEKNTISAVTKGNMIGITRQALINDDMGAFSQMATQIGRAARLSIEMDVYESLASNGGLGPVLSDGDTLFHANHANISVGAALSSTAIDADRVVMAQQTDPSGNEILDLRPDALVIAVGLGGQARVINASQFDPEAATGFMRPNKVVGLFARVVDTARLTGTRRYLFASPSIAPVLEVAFLDGQQTPFMELVNGIRLDGVEWKVRLDYGVAGVDHRGAVTNAGA